MAKKKVKMTFWQVPQDKQDDGALRFHLQADGLTPQSTRRITTLLKGWNIIAEGFDKNQTILVFSNCFGDRDEARKFVKNFPEDLIVKGYNGKDIAHF